MSFFSRIGVALLIPTLMVVAVLTPELARGARPVALIGNHTHQVETTQSPDPDDRDEGEGADEGSPLDLYGNDITDAVAKYQFDATGSLYETHSPQTEIPRLGSPKS